MPADNPRGVDNVERLAKKHLERYRLQLKAALDGRPNFNGPENARLLLLWKGVQLAGYRFDLVSPDAQAEIDDAIEAGE